MFGAIYTHQLKPKLGAAVAATGTDPSQVTTPTGVQGLPAVQQAAIVHAYASALQVVFASAIPVALLALIVSLFLKQVPMRGLTQPGASDVGHGFAVPDQRTAEEQLEGQVVRVIRTRLPGAASAILASSDSGLDAVQVWTLRQIAIQQLHAKGPADPLTVAAIHRVPLALIRPAIDDCIESSLLVEHDGVVELSERGREVFRMFVRELWAWLITQVEETNGAPLDEQGRDDLRTIARRILLSDDPVAEPTEVAQAGA